MLFKNTSRDWKRKMNFIDHLSIVICTYISVTINNKIFIKNYIFIFFHLWIISSWSISINFYRNQKQSSNKYEKFSQRLTRDEITVLNFATLMIYHWKNCMFPVYITEKETLDAYLMFARCMALKLVNNYSKFGFKPLANHVIDI